MHWHSMSIEEVLQKLDVTGQKGLSSKDARKRQVEFGPNILDSKKKKSFIVKFFAQFADFMIIILIIAAGISFVVSYLEGHPNYFEPTIILAIIILNASLGLMQEEKAEKALEALKNLSAPTAHVLRDGKVSNIDTTNLVPEILLFWRQILCLQFCLILSVNLKVKKLLTGESSVDKDANVRHIPTLTWLIGLTVMASSTITYGRGLAVVVETGMNTQVVILQTLL